MLVTDDDVSPTKEGAGIVIRTLRKGDNRDKPHMGDVCLVRTNQFKMPLRGNYFFASASFLFSVGLPG